MIQMKSIRRSLCVLGVAVVLGLGLGTARAQAAPPDAGSGAGSATGEKAGTNESLTNGGSERPWANGVTAAEQQTALAIFHDGNGFLNDGLFVKAADKYRDALKHWDHPAIHYNLALALLNLDQPVEVYDNLIASTKYGAAPLEKDKYEHAKDYLLLIEKQIADIEVSCDKPGAKVLVDGKAVFTAPGKFTQRVRIGKHIFIAEKEGYQARVKAPFIGPGEKFRIELKLYTAEDLTRYHRRWQTRWTPYAVMGAGVVFGLGGVALEESAKSSYNDFDNKIAECNKTNNNGGCAVTSPGVASLRSDGDTKKTLGYVSYSVAGAALITGGVLAYLNREEPYQIRPEDLQGEPGEAPEPRMTFAPIVTPTMAGAAVLGRF